MEDYIEIFAVFLSGFALGFITLMLWGELRDRDRDRKLQNKGTAFSKSGDSEMLFDIEGVLKTDHTTRQTYLESKLGLSQLSAPVPTTNSLASLREKIRKLKKQNYFD